MRPSLRSFLRSLRERWRMLLLLAGVAVIAAFIGQVGPARVLHVSGRLGWWIPLIVFGPSALQQAGFIVGWWLSFPRHERPPIVSLVLPHIAGEAANVVTGTANIGGEPLRALLIKPRVGLAAAGASVMEARTLRIVAQVIFIACGAAVGGFTNKIPSLVKISLFVGVPLLGVGIAAFVRLQMRRLAARTVARFQRIAARFHIHIPDRALEHAANIDRRVEISYQRGKISAISSTAVQLVAWTVLGLEPWLVANVLGRHINVGDGVLLESLTMGMATVFFFVPLGLGIVDVSRLLLFRAAGLGAAIGVTWTIVRRLQELTWTTIGLIVVRLLEPKSAHRSDPERRMKDLE